jgi:hypothetical protein
MIKPITNYLTLPMGRILAFGASAYVAVAVNPVIGLLMALVCLQAMSDFYVVEHLTMEEKKDIYEKRKRAEQTRAAQDALRSKENDIFRIREPTCECPSGYTFQINTNNCKNEEGKFVKPSMCRCFSSGYSYDTASGKCVQNSVTSSPVATTDSSPAGAEETKPPPEPNAPAASSIRPMQVDLSDADRREVLGKEPLPAPAE